VRLYTRSGDDGSTGLFGGGRVSKNDPRVEAYGTVDELNAAIGLAGGLGQLQSVLMEVGSDLATPPGTDTAKVRRIDATDVEKLETWIDEVEQENTPLTAFILPGGCERAARLHLARAICRRAERRVLDIPGGEQVVVFLNRLSDLLFALAREANREAGEQEQQWP
jgi:cob(I)alamin adenosyltransferase